MSQNDSKQDPAADGSIMEDGEYRAQDTQPESETEDAGPPDLPKGPPTPPTLVRGPPPGAPPKYRLPVVTFPLPEYRLPEGVTQKEIDIIHLTAQFVIRYGIGFYLGLNKRMEEDTTTKNPLLDFLKPSHRLFNYFDRQVVWHACIVKPSVDDDDLPAMPVVIEGFFRLLPRLEELGMHTYLGGFSPLADEECNNFHLKKLPPRMPSLRSQLALLQPYVQLPPPSMEEPYIVNPPTLIELAQHASRIAGMTPLPPLPLPESVLVPEDQFLARHPGFSTVTVFVENLHVKDIVVESLSQTVATLKKKIAGETRIPPSKQKLSGKVGLLKDNRSLAHYNVGPDDILTLYQTSY